MLQMHTIHRLDQIEMGLPQAAQRHGGSILSAMHSGRALPAGTEATVFAVGLPEHYPQLLSRDIRFAAFLPARIAACVHAGSVTLEALSPREFCRMLHRPDLEPQAAALEETLRAIMEDAAKAHAHAAAADSTSCHATEDQVNMRAALPQRIDSHGTKVEELAGVGSHDSQGG